MHEHPPQGPCNIFVRGVSFVPWLAVTARWFVEDNDGMFYLVCSRRAQAMFMGTKSSTTKEGATIFEVRVLLLSQRSYTGFLCFQHDSQVSNDGRLKMSQSRRRTISQGEVTSPTTTAPPPPPASDATPTSATPTSAAPSALPSLHSLHDKKALKKYVC